MAYSSLRSRPLDWFFILAFSVFAFTSLFVEAIGLLYESFPARGSWVLSELLLENYADVDPLFVRNPPFLRVAVLVSAFVWGPLYLYLVWGFVRGRNQIRVPALMYSSALTLAMLMIFAEELASPVPGWATPKPGKFLAFNLPYLIVPILLAIRMRNPNPFGERRPRYL